jgi:pimeloyl-ACP methyl ester carboxylesterase
VKGEFLDVGGVRLYCHAAGTRGQGAPWVFVHGFPTSSRLWGPVVSRVEPGHRMLLVDLLGFGRSDPPGGHDLTIAGHATRLQQLLATLGLRDAMLVGHDVGALVAWRLARMAPDLVRALALLNPAGRDAIGRALKIGRLAQRAPGPLRRAALARALRRGWMHEPPAGRATEVRTMLRGLSSATLERHMAGLTASAGDPLLDPAIAPPVPLALAAGAHDPWGGATNARRLADGNSAASCRILEEAGHFLPDDAPSDVAALLHALAAA